MQTHMRCGRHPPVRRLHVPSGRGHQKWAMWADPSLLPGASPMKLSIGFRLALWYFCFFAVAQLIFGVGAWIFLRDSLRDAASSALILERVKNHLLLLAPSLLVGGALLSYALSRRALTPVEAVTRSARAISGDSL